MALPRISFSWKPTISGRERWRLGLFMIVPSKSGRRNKLRIMVRGVLLWLSAMAIAAYLAAATAWFYMLNQRPHNLVTWADCVLAPVRWDEIKRKKGDAYIAEGLAAMDAMNWSDGRLKLEAGLARSPDHRRGREKLAMFYVAAGQRERGLRLMVDGIKRAYPGRENVELLLNLCFAGEDYDIALEAINLSLDQKGAAVEREHAWLVEQKGRLLIVAKRYEEALAWIDDAGFQSFPLREMRVVALLGLERYDEADAALTAWDQVQGANAGETHSLRVRVARERGDLAEMRRYLNLMRERTGTQPTAWIYAVVQEAQADEIQAAQAALGAFLMRFETNAAAMRALAQSLVKIESWGLFEQVFKRAELLGQIDFAWQTLAVEAAAKQEQYARALAVLRAIEIPEAGDELDERQVQTRKFWLNLQTAFIELLATNEAASGEELVQIVRNAAVALPAIKGMASAAEADGHVGTALALIEVARARYPGSKDIAAQAERLRQLVSESERERVEVDLPLVQNGRPLDIEEMGVVGAQPATGNFEREMGSARLFLARADELIAAEAWDSLEELMRELRRARPAWMRNQTEELLKREMELNIGRQNWSGLVGNVRFRIDGTLPRALEVMNLVRRLDAAGERRAAELVLSEIERRHDDFPPARRLREDWAAADAAAEEDAEAEATADETDG
ncbi:hypothetical protein [Actomonas aquatica]|uniref:Tetratricopeptide repeat protein n=1 Tax=Actomonas aquatica TaxID=2866162 RepID=A0ABZ1C8G0_9BACT|nr:hypothetical protein [Opitutus sp. WL0086]WRQ87768.1 hypothetical protein K1X11_023395 [Opitutus sp. WL0086]